MATTTKIASGTTESAAVELGNFTLVGVDCPTITAASLSLEVSSDNGASYKTLVTDSTGNGTNGAYTILPAASTGNVYVAVTPDWQYGVDFFKLVSSAPQGADRTFTLHFREKR